MSASHPIVLQNSCLSRGRPRIELWRARVAAAAAAAVVPCCLLVFNLLRPEAAGYGREA